LFVGGGGGGVTDDLNESYCLVRSLVRFNHLTSVTVQIQSNNDYIIFHSHPLYRMGKNSLAGAITQGDHNFFANMLDSENGSRSGGGRSKCSKLISLDKMLFYNYPNYSKVKTGLFNFYIFSKKNTNFEQFK
jgi:hypothetical protein